MEIDSLIERLRRLNVDRNDNRYTVGKAPHKALLLLSLIILKKHGRTDLYDIDPDYYLKQTWDDLWSVLDYSRPGTITQPLYHMRSEGFWNLEFESDYVKTSSIKRFRKHVERISLDDGFIQAINDTEARNLIINTLINDGGYFSDDESSRLKERIEDLDDSFVYEKRIEDAAAGEFRPMWEPEMSVDRGFIMSAKRNPAFRRLVISAYDETCAVCGIRLLTSSGITVLDAAHILPFNKFRNDDVRNGLSLCKLHHWLFDRGLISLDNDYRILVSDDVEEESPDGLLKGFRRKMIWLPEREMHHPAEEALEWHRERVFR